MASKVLNSLFAFCAFDSEIIIIIIITSFGRMHKRKKRGDYKSELNG